MSEFVHVRREGAVSCITLARPEKKNALTGAMYEALVAAFDEANREPSIGAVVIVGSPGVFTAGNDIGDFLTGAFAAAITIGNDWVWLMKRVPAASRVNVM